MVTREEVDLCRLREWTKRFPDSQTFPTAFIPLPDAVLKVIREDSIFEPDLQTENEELRSFFDAVQSSLDKWGSVFPKLDWSAPLDAAFMAGDRALRCSTVRDIWALLQGSDNFMHDLDHAYDETEVPGRTVDPTLGLRQWKRLDDAGEVRCFIKGRRLIAACQRSGMHIPALTVAPARDVVQDVVVRFTREISPKLPTPDAVVDIYLPHITPTTRPRIVDVNPWSPVTDGLLWSWGEVDAMGEGGPDAEFRFVEEGEDRFISRYKDSQYPVEVTGALTGDVDVNELLKLMGVG